MIATQLLQYWLSTPLVQKAANEEMPWKTLDVEGVQKRPKPRDHRDG